jgi:hypothetical protein
MIAQYEERDDWNALNRFPGTALRLKICQNMLPGAWVDSAQQADTGKMNYKHVKTYAWRSNVKTYHFLRQKHTTMQPVPAYSASKPLFLRIREAGTGL